MLIWSPRDDQQNTMERAAQAVHTGLGVQGSWSDANIDTKEKYRDVAKIVMKFFNINSTKLLKLILNLSILINITPAVWGSF